MKNYKVTISHTGSCLTYPEGVFQTMCDTDPTWYPYDTQTCIIYAGSRFLGGTFINLTDSHDRVRTHRQYENKEWRISSNIKTISLILIIE